MTERMLRISPCRVDDIDLLTKCAAQDDHAIISPAFVVRKGPQIVGYIGAAPTIFFWMDTHRTQVRDSLNALNFAENIYSAQGHSIVTLPVRDESPLAPYPQSLGYVLAGDHKLYLKNLQA